MDFRNTLTDWYEKNQRDLPWRKTRDPYRIWISEVVLQQTRIMQGTDYYNRLISTFPDVNSLAGAGEEDVLKAWQGLGYYSRARNLYAAAREIVTKHGGVFPGRYEELIRLKGIGEYTAAAILSIAFGQPFPVVDGNVLRFISRYAGILDRVDTLKGKRKILDLMKGYMGESDPGTFNQAVMEFGALHCVPVNPVCGQCPFRNSCLAYGNGIVDMLPVKQATKKQRNRYFHYFFIRWEDKKSRVFICLKKREEADVWKNLYDFPLVETQSGYTFRELMASGELDRILAKGTRFRLVSESGPVRHLLSHQVIHARFFILDIDQDRKPDLPFLLVLQKDAGNYPVPRLIEEFLLKNPAVL